MTDSLYGAPVTYEHGQQVIHATPQQYLSIAESLKSDGYNMLVDVTAVDYLAASDTRSLPEGVAPQRFEIVANFLSHGARSRVRVRVQVPADKPVVSTLFDLYPTADALEREVFDLMGIRFDGHPDLTRIVMPQDWEGHPLRKDYSQQRIPVQFKYTAGGYSEEDALQHRGAK